METPVILFSLLERTSAKVLFFCSLQFLCWADHIVQPCTIWLLMQHAARSPRLLSTLRSAQSGAVVYRKCLSTLCLLCISPDGHLPLPVQLAAAAEPPTPGHTSHLRPTWVLWADFHFLWHEALETCFLSLWCKKQGSSLSTTSAGGGCCVQIRVSWYGQYVSYPVSQVISYLENHIYELGAFWNAIKILSGLTTLRSPFLSGVN